MIAPIRTMKKDEIVRLAGRYCKHGHSYIEHYQCFLSENVVEGYRRGHLDIESSNLQADFGLILTWCILDNDSDTLYSDVITKEDIETFPVGQEDTRVVGELVKAMLAFDEVITWYGAKFDNPFIRTRAAIDGIPFPPYGVIKSKDLWFTCRGKFKLSSNRLENACKVILGKSQKTRLDSKYWLGGNRGDEKSLAYILNHNKKDVQDLKKLYKKISIYGRPVTTSI